MSPSLPRRPIDQARIDEQRIDFINKLDRENKRLARLAVILGAANLASFAAGYLAGLLTHIYGGF